MGKILPLSYTYRNAANEVKRYTFHEKLVLATALEGLEGRPLVLIDLAKMLIKI